jgi:hypothetical protein
MWWHIVKNKQAQMLGVLRKPGCYCMGQEGRAGAPFWEKMQQMVATTGLDVWRYLACGESTMTGICTTILDMNNSKVMQDLRAPVACPFSDILKCELCYANHQIQQINNVFWLLCVNLASSSCVGGSCLVFASQLRHSGGTILGSYRKSPPGTLTLRRSITSPFSVSVHLQKE